MKYFTIKSEVKLIVKTRDTFKLFETYGISSIDGRFLLIILLPLHKYPLQQWFLSASWVLMICTSFSSNSFSIFAPG